jgi:hypothetical protein
MQSQKHGNVSFRTITMEFPKAMPRRYYSSRNKRTSLTLNELYWKVQNLYLLFRDRDYFKGKAKITKGNLPEDIKHAAAIALTFQPFPVTHWHEEEITADHIFDMLEFLFDHVSKPGEMVDMVTDTNWNYRDYGDYDDAAGQNEFREQANTFLCDYGEGFELTPSGTVLASGSDVMRQILTAEIEPYDEKNVDSKVRNAILKWRNRHLSFDVKKEAIRELADVFEWLKKTKKLDGVLEKKDESAIFEIANNFAIRHHNPQQKTGYDKKIWYAWMFHFYLATYHATIHLLLKKENARNNIKFQ